MNNFKLQSERQRCDTIYLKLYSYFLELDPASCPVDHSSMREIMPLYPVVSSQFLKEMLALLVVTSRCCCRASILNLLLLFYYLFIFIIVNAERNTIYSCLTFANLRWADGVYFFVSYERVLHLAFALAISFLVMSVSVQCLSVYRSLAVHYGVAQFIRTNRAFILSFI